MLRIAIIVFAFMLLPFRVQAKEITLVKSGKTAYTIIVASDASPSELHAARELQDFVAQMSGAQMPILTDAYPLPEKAVVLGENRWSQTLVPDLNVKELAKEGYIQKTVGEHLVITGGKPRGTLFGVYGILEDHLGCRWFTPDCSRIPKSKTIVLSELDERIIPRLEYRDPFYSDGFDGDWVLRNRMNSSRAAGVESKGGKVQFSDLAFCHTFF
ncbi:MAG TPA: alpha-glucuronidase family glycosyl hydrolase, partial [bacterium]|nr:alpha-glucuronidase family glycosyl hydrolase [bacterium]